MLKNESIICISSIDWDFIWQANQEIMASLAQNGNRVLFIENTGLRAAKLSDFPRINKRIINWINSVKGFKEKNENLFIYSPIVLPFPYSRIARFINKQLVISALRRWMRIMEFYNPIIWTFLPTPLCLDIVNNIPHKALVYYNIDNLASTSSGAQKVIKYEQEVVKLSDVVFAMSDEMAEYFSKYNKNSYRIPAGVNVKLFLDVYHQKTIYTEEYKAINNKIVGYIGGVRKSIDLELVNFLAEHLPNFTFIFIGPIQINIAKLKNIKNIIFLGQKKHEELPSFIKYFDACIIPYKKDAYTNNVSPAKLNEYLIMGKPVISTDLKEVVNFNKENENIVYIAKDDQSFLDLILNAIKEDNEDLRAKRIEVACRNSWDKKIGEMSGLIEYAINKKKEAVTNWQESLIKIYRGARKKIANFALIISIVWLLVFYSPLIWFLASPLKIYDNPQKSDAIVVFAGGVGESGNVGQGYEERVQYAVQLYKLGYANKLIFSSGSLYAFKEPLVMKALAVSLGAPEGAIILEDKARSTYENVKFSKNILEQNNWKKIILISSPYHMLRVSLVFNKIAKDILVYYAPIPESRFYAHSQPDSLGRKTWRQISIEQINGIFHEYIGILYYWLKRYI